MWKFLNERARGTSHALSGIPCQDSHFVSRYANDIGEFLILCCADGAGSAAESLLGSSQSCEAIMESASGFFESGGDLSQITAEVAKSWARKARERLQCKASELGTTLRELACTLLFGIVGSDRSVFAQIGDGAIVILQDDEYRPVFWPQNGEYLNTTFFVTDEDFEQRFQVSAIDQRIDELAMFTDGLQMLALNCTDRKAHQPFFAPMFRALRSTTDAQELIVPLKQFLDSPAVNSRTDDDKTLILATRVTGANAFA